MKVLDYKNETHEILTIEELYLWAKEKGLEKSGLGISIYDERDKDERADKPYEYCEEIKIEDIEKDGYEGGYYIRGHKVEDFNMIWLCAQ